MLEILQEIENRGIAFEQLLTVPEQDEWIYSDGKSTTCVAFILAMYKEAGVFHPLYDSIQVTEFTVSTKILFTSLIFFYLSSLPRPFLCKDMSIESQVFQHFCFRMLVVFDPGLHCFFDQTADP